MRKKTRHQQYTPAGQLHSEDDIPINVKDIKRYRKNKIEYYNYPVAFDIETSSFYEGEGEYREERACMYVWQMCLGDSDFIVVGRTWEEWLYFIRLLRKKFHLKKDRVLIIWVHNLAYEMQFIRKFFQWDKVFALDTREPLYMRTNFGIEFRCSYRLSGYRLEKLAENLQRHKMEKLVGNLDYSKVRHSKTPISQDEMDYNIMDVRIVCAYISERLEIDGNITKIPLTKTGYVRNACKLACYGSDHTDGKYIRYRQKMKSLTMTEHEYRLLRCAFMGGYTHANSFYIDEVLENVTSQDFTSSYPYVLTFKYPWSKGILCYPTIDEVMKDLDRYGWVLDLELYDVQSTTIQDDFLSYSRCIDCEGYTLNNGRVNSAKYVHVVVTSVDLDIILKTYKCLGGIKIVQAYKYYLSYLPTDFIVKMLSYYVGKTELKDVEGKDEEYLHNKENLNSFYGMVVTSPVRDTIKYINDEWLSEKTSYKKGIAKYNNSSSRFMPWVVGVFVTAYARRNLWSGILECGSDYVYSDTDSVKLLNFEDHKEYFENYNKGVVEHLHRVCEHHKIPWDMVAPKTVEGKEKILGVWDFDGFYTRFKTLGAKRYMTEKENGEISLTVAGLNKKKAVPYMLDKYGRDKIFDAFTDDEFHISSLEVPEDYSGRTVSTYIDEETEGDVIDYLGNVGHYHELSSVHIRNGKYTLSLSEDYIKFLFGIRKKVL